MQLNEGEHYMKFKANRVQDQKPIPGVRDKRFDFQQLPLDDQVSVLAHLEGLAVNLSIMAKEFLRRHHDSPKTS